jgi:hypothetical protein
MIVGAVWLLVALAFAIASWLRGRRAIADVLANASDAAPRAHAALARVTREPIALRQSESIIAPAAIGIVRPTIVIPSPDALDDDELETILAHECAHIARRDNLLGIIETIAAAALWFHPLVWIARRVLAATREAACDEAAIAGARAETYLSALAKICSAAVAPRGAGISCIGGNTIKRRMETIMHFELRRTLSHRITLALSITLIAAFTFAAGVVRATPADAHGYKVTTEMTRDGSQATFQIEIVDTQTNQVIHHPRVTTSIGVPATLTMDGDPKLFLKVLPNPDGTAEVNLEVTRDGKVVQTMKSMVTPKSTATHGDGVSVELRDADLRDTMRTFEKLANVTIEVPEGVNGKVTINIHDVPWPAALRLIAQNAGHTLSKESDTHFTVR